MPARVTYWLHTWDPRQEGISKDVAALRTGARANAFVVAFSTALETRWYPRDRVVTLSGDRWLLLRGLASVLERAGQVAHVFGGPSSWHLLRALGRRPVVLTAVEAFDPRADQDWRRVAALVVETEDAKNTWRGAVPDDRLHVIRPGVDLSAWQRVARPGGRFRLLFASTPSDASELDARGIPLLVALAERRPDIDVCVPWRQWGDVHAARAALASLRAPANFLVSHDPAADMPVIMASAHATITCFAAGIGKSCPNFVVEGLAAGRPALVTDTVGLAPLIARTGAGVVTARDPDALARGVDRLCAEWPMAAGRARALAQAEFGVDQFRARYDALYADVVRGTLP
jgi:glycosyltransferase involved in cell wall biosynthesis